VAKSTKKPPAEHSPGRAAWLAKLQAERAALDAFRDSLPHIDPTEARRKLNAIALLVEAHSDFSSSGLVEKLRVILTNE
jgi:hypothetical protein